MPACSRSIKLAAHVAQQAYLPMPNIFGLYILLSCFFFINSLIYICLLVPHIWKSVGTKNFLLTARESCFIPHLKIRSATHAKTRCSTPRPTPWCIIKPLIENKVTWLDLTNHSPISQSAQPSQLHLPHRRHFVYSNCRKSLDTAAAIGCLSYRILLKLYRMVTGQVVVICLNCEALANTVDFSPEIGPSFFSFHFLILTRNHSQTLQILQGRPKTQESSGRDRPLCRQRHLSNMF